MNEKREKKNEDMNQAISHWTVISCWFLPLNQSIDTWIYTIFFVIDFYAKRDLYVHISENSIKIKLFLLWIIQVMPERGHHIDDDDDDGGDVDDDDDIDNTVAVYRHEYAIRSHHDNIH